MTARKNASQGIRLARALLIVFVALFSLIAFREAGNAASLQAPGLVGDVVSATVQSLSSTQEASGNSQSGYSFVVDRLLPRQSGWQQKEAPMMAPVCELPKDISDEVSLPCTVDKCLLDAESKIVGYSCSNAPDDALRELIESMSENGWTSFSMEGLTGTTFLKEDGKLRWGLATATMQGDASFVVLRLAE